LSITTITQIASTVSSIVVGFIFAYLYWRLIKLQRFTIDEQKEQRISGGRPQIIVEADYRRLPEIDLVVRNVGGGPAKNIGFEFSANIKSSTGFVLTDLFYLRDGMDFLAPGGEIRCLWDDMHSLEETLKEEGLQHGIWVRTSYEGMNGDTYDENYGINPLLYQGIRNATRRDMDDLVELLDERLPGEGAGDQSPDSAEEFEQQRDNEEQEDQQDNPQDNQQGGEQRPRGQNDGHAGNGRGDGRAESSRTTPEWAERAQYGAAPGDSNNQTNSN
jgi:hypothetical protein